MVEGNWRDTETGRRGDAESGMPMDLPVVNHNRDLKSKEEKIDWESTIEKHDQKRVIR